MISTTDSSLAMSTKTVVITASVDTVPMTSCETEISFDMLFDTNYCVLVELSDPGTPVDMVFKIRHDEPDTIQIFDEFNDNPAPSGSTYCGGRLYAIFDTDGNRKTS
jgi:hypothetical protein